MEQIQSGLKKCCDTNDMEYIKTINLKALSLMFENDISKFPIDEAMILTDKAKDSLTKHLGFIGDLLMEMHSNNHNYHRTSELDIGPKMCFYEYGIKFGSSTIEMTFYKDGHIEGQLAFPVDNELECYGNYYDLSKDIFTDEFHINATSELCELIDRIGKEIGQIANELNGV